jgi:hypothetical protein
MSLLPMYQSRYHKPSTTAAIFRGPRVAAIDYTATVDTVRRDLTAKFDIVLRNGSSIASNFTSLGAYTAFIQGVKAINPTIKWLNYVIVNQWNTSNGAWSALANDLNATGGKGGLDGKPWWVFDAGTSTQLLLDGSPMVNLTTAVAADSNGDRWPQVCGKWWINTMYSGALGAALGMDGVWTDNTFYAPRKSNDANLKIGDINLDGVNETIGGDGRASSSTIRAAYRTGVQAFWTQMSSLHSGLKIGGNSDYDASAQKASVDTTELTGRCDYPFLESCTGKSFSTENSAGFSGWMTWYASAENGCKAGGSVWVHASADSVTNASRAYRIARYILAVAHLRNGYACVADNPSGGSNQPIWYSDFDPLVANIGTAVDPVQTAAWSSNVWRRRYQNGAVFVVPTDTRGGYFRLGGLSLIRTANVVTLSGSGLTGHGAVAGDLIRWEMDGVTPADGSFKGCFAITAVTATSISWAQTGAADTSSLTGVEMGWWALQTTIDLTGQGYKRILTTSDAHNNYDGTLVSGSAPVYTSQNDGTACGLVKLWAGDGLVVVAA